MNTENFKELTFDEVKSWVQSQEMTQNIEVNWEQVNKLCKYFYPGAVKLKFQLGGEWDDSGYDLTIKGVAAFSKDGESILCPNLSEFYNEHKDSVLMSRSKYKDLYINYGNFHRNFPLSIDEIYFGIKLGCINFNNQGAGVSSDFTSEITLDIENQRVENPVVPKIYGIKS